MNVFFDRKWVFAGMVCMIAGGCVSCSSKRGGDDNAHNVEKSDSVPKEVKHLVKVVADDDSAGFARMVSYPLRRPYPLHDIDTPEEMRRYYHTLVDDSLRHAIVAARPSQWQEYGWRGWTLGEGEYLWVDEDVYDVNYISRAERLALDSLVEVEIRSLDPSLREGWRPEMCLRDTCSGWIYRIDKRTTDTGSKASGYRLAVYSPGSDLSRRPDHTVEGSKDEGGSAGFVSYGFSDGTHDVTIEPDSPAGQYPLIYMGADSVSALKRVYWTDLLPSGK